MNVISIVFNSFQNDSRVLKEAITLKKNGYNVTVVALKEGNLLEKEKVSGIKVHRIPLKSKSWSKHKVVQLLKYMEMTYKVFKYYRNVDIVHCNDLGPLPLAIFLKWWSRGKIKVVYDAHEFETEQQPNINRLLKKLMIFIEAFCLKYVDASITVSSGIAIEYEKRYKIPRPSVVLNCPFRYKGEIVSKDLFRKKFGIKENQLIFLYQGALVQEKGIELLVETFSQLSDDYVLVFMGYGPLKEKVIEATKKYTNIFFHDAVPFKEILNYTSSADVGFCILHNTCLNNYYCLPNKFFEYTMVGLPVISNKLFELEKLIKKYNCGYVVEDLKVSELKKLIQSIDKNDLYTMSINARKLSNVYNWENQEKVLIDLYSKLI